MTPQEQKACIQEMRFDDLFIGQGWDEAASRSFPLELRDGEIFQIEAKFQKRGFAVCFCNDPLALRLNTADRRRLLQKLGKVYYEHLLIIHGENEQHWLVSIRPQDQPLRVAMVQWQKGQDVQKLREKLAGLIFPMAEEATLSITDVVERVRTAFSVNAEKISKEFYKKFQKELQLFDEFIKGIQDKVKSKEYAALMLNRLMFIYFMQKKGFLDGDINYLKNRLQQTKKRLGKDEFHGFYREFLRCLFHDGLGAPASERSNEINELLGKVPYLNGGLFDPSQLEIENDGITISDAAFERLFNFFDKYNWYLDDNSTASGQDINPEVLGYIFEKYINDRAQMGAYYTQEDITGYIAKNTLLPFLLRRAREGCKNAFEDSGVWRLLRDNPDHYIYDAVKHGCEPPVKHGCELPDDDIPEDIRRGIDTAKPDLLERRSNWNTPAPKKFALPTETWREVIARRERYFELHNKLKAGEIREIDDLITYNLDIIRFVGDTLLDYEGADYIAAVFRAIAGVRQNWVKGTNEKTKRGISVLDPSCGSGAFLFAALKILEPLYEACIGRMEEFINQDDDNAKAGKGKKYPFFRKVLEEIGKHQNRRYWICKTIILENLYGVDIMGEAAEITKLRLFLKLAAVAEYNPNKKNLGLEPLPDIDYNIRSGNSLVGFASMKEFEQVAGGALDLSGGLLKQVREQAEGVQKANDRFRQAQDRGDSSYVEAKKELAEKLAELNEKLNQYLAEDYGQGKDKPKRYEQWKASHQPFHWLADFYGIIEENGGFDVVIGNPPYVEYKEDKEGKPNVGYNIIGYKTKKCGNLYAFLIERVISIQKDDSYNGMIIPLSAYCTDRMALLQQSIHENSANLYISFYAERPSKLFFDAENSLSISVFRKNNITPNKTYTTRFHKWYAHERNVLFQNLSFSTGSKNQNITDTYPKIDSKLSKSVYEKINSSSNTLSICLNGENQCYYHNAARYWIRATDFIPYFWNERDGEKQSVQIKTLDAKKEESLSLCSLINSSLFYWWYITMSDCRHLNLREINNFPINLTKFTENHYSDFAKINKQLMANYRQHAIRKETTYKTTGKVIYDEFHPSHGKEIMDKIDIILAQHYGFTDEELDYIINYDIKYRMGGNNE